MLDCSRNGVLHFEAYKDFAINAALMGYQDRFTIMLNHLNKVMEITRKYNYKPVMWSDMFFRLGSGGGYYETDWEMSDNIIFAGGAWKWSGFTPANLFSHKIAKLAHESCQENGIKRVIITAWGDNGAEASANNPAPGKCGANPSKNILYQDILTGLLDQHIDKATYTLHFQNCSRELNKIIKTKASKWNYIFETQKALCDVLAIKTHTGINIRAAYKDGNKERLETYANVFLPELRQAVESFIMIYRRQWTKENKSFGLDVFDIRMGGLIQRIKTAQLLIIQQER